MIGTFHMLRDEGIKFCIALYICAWLNFLAPEGIKGRLSKD